MELTHEQQAIIRSTGDIKINAVAGSGKTTTIIAYAKARPRHGKILYLAFNKAVKLEAVEKFAEKGVFNVQVETAHSLAYKHIVYPRRYTVRPHGYKIHEIVELLRLKGNGEKHTEYVVANHISRFMAYFCNSDKPKVQDLNYLEVVSDGKARAFVTTFYHYIESQTRLLLSKMDSGEIEITHDFYLKKFQLSNPELWFDYILFDEGQDASPAMLDIFFKQKATKVIVGDTHQQIYGWRYAVNSLEKALYTTYHLSTSFRFGADIATLAMEVLKWKSHFQDYSPVTVKGSGTTAHQKTTAVLGRTNLGLLLRAIEYVKEKKLKTLYFEGNINSYTYADEGASLYDVLNLYNGKRKLIKDTLIRQMTTLGELEDYIQKTEDVQLGMMVEIVKEYGNEIPGIIKEIKEKHVDNDDKEKAEVIFSTVHRCKGMEYDVVHLVNDFISEEKLERLPAEAKKEEATVAKLNEEVNLLYVAVTRAKSNIHIPEALIPKNFQPSSRITVVKTESADAQETAEASKGRETETGTTSGTNNEKAYTVAQVRQVYQGAYMPWTEELDAELTALYAGGKRIKDMAAHFGRTTGAIRSRIKKLELEPSTH